MVFESSGLKLYYTRSGCGDPLILLHGNGEDHRIFDKARPVLEKHFTVYCLDSRGHGQSSPVSEYHYEEMAEDVFKLISELGLEKPVVYGFSDGGIIALLLTIRHPGLLSRIIVSGVNCTPGAMVWYWRYFYRVINAFRRNPLYTLMLEEPDITSEMLASIDIPVSLTAGAKDVISPSHLEYIERTIPCCQTRIFPGENHGSYIVNSEKIARHILRVCGKI